MTGRGRKLAIAVVALAAGAAVLGLWRWGPFRQISRLEPGWTAVAFVLAGDGIAAFRDGDASRARFSDPFGVATTADGSIYVADAGDSHRVRRIARNGDVSTIAGSVEGYADGPAATARFSTPSGLAVGADGTIYVADTANNAIRRITPDGVVSTLAGDAIAGYRDATGREARFNGPVGIAVDPSGRLLVADTYNDRIRAIAPDGRVTTVAGSGQRGVADGAPEDARFDTPCGVAMDPAGNVFVADTGNGVVRVISSAGIVSTVGPPPPYGLQRPIGIAVTPEGLLYVTDERGRIVEISPGLAARTLAGSRPGFADGVGDSARFSSLAGVALDGPGRIVVADSRNALVRIVAATSRLELRPPASPRIRPAFDVEAFARDGLLWPLVPMDGPFEITGTLGEARGGVGGERFHAGLDVHAPEGTPVVAVRTATVSSPASAGDFDSLNESVRVGPIAYVHLRVGRLPGPLNDEVLDPSRFVPTYDESNRLIGIRVKRGARFTTGEVIGSVNRFNHVHLNVGWPGEEHNPLSCRLVQFEDAVLPTIARRGIRLFDETGNAITQRKKGRLTVDGRVHVIVDAWDQVNGNERRRRLGLYELGYQVLHPDGSPAPGFERVRPTIRFDRLAPDDEAARTIFWSGSGIPFFGGRSTHFLYVVTSTLRGGVATPGVWDTTSLPPGDYTLRIFASDIHGNVAMTNRDVLVTVGGGMTPQHTAAQSIKLP